MSLGPPPPGPVQAGQICDPDNISAADAAAAKNASLSCQVTGAPQTYLIPSSFQNAMMGDIILSPGEDSASNMIGEMLRSLPYPHYHSHSGLMTLNYYQITHCTASPDRLTASSSLVPTPDIPGLPVNLPPGLLGIQPDILQYAWPGSITQTVDNAINGEYWNDPVISGTQYKIAGFNPEPLGIENDQNQFTLIYPMVVKPLPENEATARPLLRTAATFAASKGAQVDSTGKLTKSGGAYYCFYNYTSPSNSAGFSDPAPASAGWAQGLSPAVCSSFIWMCMKANGINLVGPTATETAAELSSWAIANGEQVGPPSKPSLDGLFYYSASERQSAANVLNSVLNNMIVMQVQWAQYIPLVGAAVMQDIADQVLNEFAFGDPNMWGSPAWQNPGDANAVAPDDIWWGWNPPYFGYAEYLQFLPAHSEQYSVSTWVPVTTYGTVSGNVTFNGAAVQGAYVFLNDMLNATTDGNGNFQINNVPTGSYYLNASKTVTVDGLQVQVQNGPNGPAGQGQPITTTPGNPNLTVNVVLQPLGPGFRSLSLTMFWSSDHGDMNPNNQHGVVYQGAESDSIPLGPGTTTGTYSHTFEYNNQGLFHCEYDFTASLNIDLSIDVLIVGKMIDDGSHKLQDSNTLIFNVPAGGMFAWELDLYNSGTGYHNGPAIFTGTAYNLQLTQ